MFSVLAAPVGQGSQSQPFPPVYASASWAERFGAPAGQCRDHFGPYPDSLGVGGRSGVGPPFPFLGFIFSFDESEGEERVSSAQHPAEWLSCQQCCCWLPAAVLHNTPRRWPHLPRTVGTAGCRPSMLCLSRISAQHPAGPALTADLSAFLCSAVLGFQAAPWLG